MTENTKNQTAQAMTAKLWEMANQLRGTMDASEYKNYILPFMFYHYLSDKQDAYLAEQALMEDFADLLDEIKDAGTPNEWDEDTKADYDDMMDELASGLGYAVDPRFTWAKMMERIAENKIAASDFSDMIDTFRENAKRADTHLEGMEEVFSDVNFSSTRLGNNVNERAKALIRIMNMLNEFNFKDENGHDILGDVYEYLIGQFAANAGKKGGEFYTPHEVSQILAKIVTQNAAKLEAKNDEHQFRVYDPTMGSGSLLLTVKRELPNAKQEGAVDFYGQEINTTTFNLARMNLMMHGESYANLHLRCADTLGTDWPFTGGDDDRKPRTFDAVVANPPYSQKWDTKDIDRTKDARFKMGVAPASKADYAFVLHGLYHLDEDGTMAIVLPHGVLFRGGTEGKIRKAIIEENMLDAVIGLPANLFYGTSIPTCVLVFKGRHARSNRHDVLFIDASKHFEKGKNQNKLTAKNIDEIVKAYTDRNDVDKYAHVATLDEIKENDYNLNIPRYVDTFEEVPVKPLSQIATELNDVQKDIDTTNAKLLDMLSQLDTEDAELKTQLDQFINALK